MVADLQNMSNNVGEPFVVLNCDGKMELVETFVDAIDKIPKVGFDLRQVLKP